MKKKSKKQSSLYNQPKLIIFQVACFFVHIRAVSLYFALFYLNSVAVSGTKGSSGFGSVSNELIDNNTLDIVNAGDH